MGASPGISRIWPAKCLSRSRVAPPRPPTLAVRSLVGTSEMPARAARKCGNSIRWGMWSGANALGGASCARRRASAQTSCAVRESLAASGPAVPGAVSKAPGQRSPWILPRGRATGLGRAQRRLQPLPGLSFPAVPRRPPSSPGLAPALPLRGGVSGGDIPGRHPAGKEGGRADGPSGLAAASPPGSGGRGSACRHHSPGEGLAREPARGHRRLAGRGGRGLARGAGKGRAAQETRCS